MCLYILGGVIHNVKISNNLLYRILAYFRFPDIAKASLQKLRSKRAVNFDVEWNVEGSKAKGRKMMNQQTKMMLRAFNGESDNLILKVKYNNVLKTEERITSIYKAVNKLSTASRCYINGDYLDLKLKELHLVHEHQEKKQAELEEQRSIREQMREEERAMKELQKAQEEAEKEEKRYQKALEKAKKEIEKATGEKHSKLETEIERLNELLIEVQANKERAKSRAQMTKSGYVYVVSNIGSFGEGVYKIGMTRRLDPMDRVTELGGASVPFRFDVHAMIFSENAPALESLLHKTFDNRRVNRINPRKEFFKVSLEEIKREVLKNQGEIEFTLLAKAEEFRKTLSLVERDRANVSEFELFA